MVNGYDNAEQYGLRWREFAKRKGNLVTKEKWFRSAEARAHFAGVVSEKGNFYEFVSWSDPTQTVH